MNILKSSARFVRKLISLFILLLILNIVFIIIFASNQPNRQSSENLTNNIVQEIKEIDSSPTLSLSGKELVEKNNLWVIIINADSGELEYAFKKPTVIPTKYNLSDIAKLSRFYLEDYPVFNQSIGNHIVIVGFPKNEVIRFSANYIEKQDIRFYSLLVLGLFIFNVCYFITLYVTSVTKINNKLKPLSTAIQNLPRGGSYHDIEHSDEFSALTEAIKTADKQLKENTLFKKNWIDGIAHDIRTPLSVIISNADLVKTETFPADGVARRMNNILVESYYIQNTLNDLNILERITNQQIMLQASTTKALPFFKEIIIKFINQQMWENFDISFDYSEKISEQVIFIEKNLMSRVVHNIIYNTILHNPNGCCIDIYLEIVDNKLELCIQDNGVGVSTDKLDNLNKSEDSLTMGVSGINRHGIGLKISKQIIELHNGTIVFNSMEKKYFKTTILLPIS